MKTIKELGKEITSKVEELKDRLINEIIPCQVRDSNAIKSLQSEVERLKGGKCSAIWGNSLQEKVKKIERAVNEGFTLLRLGSREHAALQEKVERLEKKEDLNEQEFCAIRDVLREVRDHIIEESPNQSDCPLGHECKEGYGRWVPLYQGHGFEECGESCPKSLLSPPDLLGAIKKKDERAETIRRAREIVMGVWEARRMITPGEGHIVLKALSYAEQSNKGE